MPETLPSLLDRALAALRRTDHREALAAWRRHPARELADAIEAVGSRAQLGLEPVARGRT